MTALCGGGTSGPLPLTLPIIDLTSIGVAGLARKWGFPDLEYPIALAAGALNIIVNSYCATDPPPDPGLTAQDIIDAASIMLPGVSIPAQARIQQWFLHRYWWEVCTCIAGSTPAPPPMSNPNTPIGVNTGAPSGGNAGPCWTSTAAATITMPNIANWGTVEPWLPSGPGSTVSVPAAQHNPIICVLPPGVQSITWAFEHLSSDAHIFLNMAPMSLTGTEIGTFNLADSAISGVQSGTRAWPTGSPAAQIHLNEATDTQATYHTSWQGTLSLICSGQPPNQLVQPCCPPDPLIELKLDHIFSLVLNLYNNQGGGGGGAGPVDWIDGARHTGLHGNGSFGLVGNAIGVRVEMTTPPIGVTVKPGTPPFFYDTGFITPLAHDTPLRGQRLVFNPQSFSLPNFTDGIGYTLLAGTVVNVVELLPVF